MDTVLVRKGWNVGTVDPEKVVEQTKNETDFDCGNYDAGKLDDQGCGLEDRV